MESHRELFETYRRDVYRTCYFMLHDAADAEDLTQEVFMTLFRQNRENVEHMKAWIMRITVNLCLNYMRRRRSLERKISANPSLFAASEGRAVDQQVEEKESAEELAMLMNSLPAKIRAVLLLRYMHDFSLIEISQLLSIPLGTTKSRLHKGHRLMKNLLVETGMKMNEWEASRYENTRKYAEAKAK